jgi:phage baseplate assembly protein W
MTFFARLHGARLEPRGVEAMVEQLSNVLNSTRGFASVRREFGVDDCVAVRANPLRAARSLGINALRAEVEECIRLFEPEVEGASVEVLGRGARGQVVLGVDGRFAGGPLRLRVTFDPETRVVNVREEDA